ncbi:alginate lyase family protein [Geojedonia litorea]|uniref:Alginate lyase family protein n=1 Tax=Geojedonia litorea TaxID=1268269 RepID=A0ABV9N6J4_9FLAO
MKIILNSILTATCCFLLTSCNTSQAPETLNTSEPSHPKLILTANGVNSIKSQLGKTPLFDKSLEETKAEVDAEIALGIDVPVPKDFSGGYTHERHKKNFLILQKAGVLFQILDDEKYAIYIRDMLMAYAKLYPTLPVHPQTRSYARGKLFWQCLNDSNWLVYTSQAYDCIYNWLSKEERDVLENDLFKPFADFISIENPQFFNRVHNHSTWGNVAVGMIALVMDDDSLLQRALYGIKNVNLDANMKDNDGGFINKDGKVGFFANLDEPFSPDGYYTEGPYYQRYAMYPFLIFAEALQNKKPELKIFQYKDSVLLKSVKTLINLSDADGDFFPINDAQKGMSYYSRELVTAVDIAYHFGGNDPQLLSIAQKQDRVVLDDSGMSVANDLQLNKAKPFVKSSIELRDGPNGDQGGIGILRNEPMELVFKYAAQGLSHGHYDKLSYSMYEDGNEVLQDYGLARFVNIEQKGGGNYLKENTTWAKQTIAHNTVVQNEASHFNGEYEIGSMYHSEGYLFDIGNRNLQVVSAKEKNAYPGTEMHRTMAMIKDSSLTKPFVLDIVKVTSNKPNQYDFPFYYLGQLMQTNFEYSAPKSLAPLGAANGYQHLYSEGKGISDGNNSTLNWLLNGKFYTLTTVTSQGDELHLARVGANDPNFNLRRDPALILRKKNSKDALFVSIIESHGTYSPVSELAINAYSNIKKLEVLFDDSYYTAVAIWTKDEHSKLFIISNTNNQKTQKHQISINGKEYQWTGPFTFQNIK